MLGLTLADGDWLGDTEGEIEGLMDGEKLALGDWDGDTEADGD
jgi:hypothetical protein